MVRLLLKQLFRDRGGGGRKGKKLKEITTFNKIIQFKVRMIKL